MWKWPWRPAPQLLRAFESAARRLAKDARREARVAATARAETIAGAATLREAQAARRKRDDDFMARYERAVAGPWSDDLYDGPARFDLATGCGALFEDAADLEKRAARRARSVARESAPPGN